MCVLFVSTSCCCTDCVEWDERYWTHWFAGEFSQRYVAPLLSGHERFHFSRNLGRRFEITLQKRNVHQLAFCGSFYNISLFVVFVNLLIRLDSIVNLQNMIFDADSPNRTLSPPVPPADNALSTLKFCNESLSLLTNTTADAPVFGTMFFAAWCVRWLVHVVGDAHQPCHAVELRNAQFPTGDRGCNLW